MGLLGYFVGWKKIRGGTAGHCPVSDDTTNFVYIDRGDIIELAGELFLVRGHEKEGRFGVDEQPKFWVRCCVAFDGGVRFIRKLRCKESFKVPIGDILITCARDSEKEARVLDRVRGDARFMQGRSVRDKLGNLVRIKGKGSGLVVCDLIVSNDPDEDMKNGDRDNHEVRARLECDPRSQETPAPALRLSTNRGRMSTWLI